MVAFSTIASLIVFAASVAANIAVADETVLDATARMRAVPGDDAPSETSIASWVDVVHVNEEPEVVTLEVSASVPSVNLENVPGFYGIECFGSKATASFESVVDIAAWNLEPTLLLIASQYMCGIESPHQFTMLLATTWTVDTENNSVVFETADPEENGVTGSFRLIANPLVAPASDDCHASQLVRRDLNSSLGSYGPAMPFVFQGYYDSEIYFPVPHTPLIVDGRCRNCSFAGDTIVRLSAEGSLFPFSIGAAAEWSGSLKSDIDLALNVTVNETSPLRTATIPLAETFMYPIAIPGLINTTAIFRVNAQTNINVDSTGEIGLRLKSDLPQFYAKYSTLKGVQVDKLTPLFDVNVYPYGPINGEIDVTITSELSFNYRIFGRRFEIPGGSYGIVFADKTKFVTQDNVILATSSVKAKLELGVLFTRIGIPILGAITFFKQTFPIVGR